MKVLVIILTLLSGVVPSGQSYLKQLQPRDSILIADQLEYGVELQDVKEGTELALQDYAPYMKDTLTLVRSWQIDTLKIRKGADGSLYNLRLSVVVAPFEEGTYELPEIAVKRVADGSIDTLLFEAQTFEAKTILVDTATFEIRDIKGQINYPVTFREILPYILAAILLAAIIAAVIYLVKKLKRRTDGVEAVKDPPYIVALRSLERLRGDKYWAPDKQKILYSGITDTLRTYMENRFDVNAEEMTTAEIFKELKGMIPDDLYTEAKSLFETADFVKFAKYTVSDEQNAKAVPAAVRFVTSTYQEEEKPAAGEGVAQ